MLGIYHHFASVVCKLFTFQFSCGYVLVCRSFLHHDSYVLVCLSFLHHAICLYLYKENYWDYWNSPLLYLIMISVELKRKNLHILNHINFSSFHTLWLKKSTKNLNKDISFIQCMTRHFFTNNILYGRHEFKSGVCKSWIGTGMY